MTNTPSLKPIPGWGMFSISDTGVIPGVLTTFDRDSRFSLATLWDPETGRRQTFEVGSLVLLAFYGPAPESHPFVKHLSSWTDNSLKNLDYSSVDESSVPTKRVKWVNGQKIEEDEITTPPVGTGFSLRKPRRTRDVWS